MKEMNMFEEKGFSCNTVSTKLGTKDGLVQRYDGLLHYQGELGDFWYDPREFELIEIFDKECLHYAGESALVHFPKGCISTRCMFYRSELPEGFKLIDFDTFEVVDMSYMFYDCKMSSDFSLGANFDTSHVENMCFMFGFCKFQKAISLGDKFDTSNVTDMSGMYKDCELPSGFSLGDEFTFKAVINVSEMFFGAHIPESFSLNDFDFNVNRDYADMFSGCKFPAGFWLGGFPVKQLEKIVCSFTSEIVF